jgi:uncharacterized protein
LRYKIKDIPGEGQSLEEAAPHALLVDALSGVDADVAHSRVRVSLTLSKDRDENVYARGDIKGEVTLPCASCLCPARVPIDARVQMTFVREGEEPGEGDDPLAEADFAFHDGETIDLDPVVREQIILALPISARCKEGCLGLCSVCGQNKNEGDCGHRPESLPDPRLQALKDIKLT